mmetsp:Transcript_17824/g.39078  ORF Transcript_17824/g.39078 Transcript_17824/m.39078 type:complete len:182 (-) Transcript_17824:44-589(-)|eukprot:CAMPEP_0170614670 /NCGR_PEP_ID=MMETSP0224-20130122/24928_1 /TAXON_ID=285029 /ORGANISM="Togula jolla, Strain CCCM 725" /LENGTH=181 /DNA_ID=CAMNT_0010940351 /DNA_START=157 /DNA_END=702 /DNA_ORIENTATION=+
MIDPGTKRDGEDYNAYCRRRWGGDGWTNSLRERGKSMGLKFGEWKYWPNTLNAHRLCAYLEEMDAANPALSEKEKEMRGLELVNKFYELTYERGVNISTPEGAALAMEELGFAKSSDVVPWLEGGGGQQEVAAADTYAKREMAIGGVPYFLVSSDKGPQQVPLSGAQSSSAFEKAFQRVSS